MIPYISLILLAFAVSLDSFSVGLTYGLRKMHMPLKSISIIACCSAVTLLFAMSVGTILMNFLSPAFAEKVGGGILIILGMWVLYQFFKAGTAEESITVDERILFNLEIKSLGVVINILRKPTEADFDRSGSINGLEAFSWYCALTGCIRSRNWSSTLRVFSWDYGRFCSCHELLVCDYRDRSSAESSPLYPGLASSPFYQECY